MTDSQIFHTSTLTQSFDHLEELTSSGQLQTLSQSFVSLQTLLDTSHSLILQLQKQLKANVESDSVSNYPQQMLQWLKNLQLSLSQKDENIRMIQTQLTFLQEQSQIVPFQRKRLELLSIDSVPSSKLIQLRQHVNDLQEQVRSQRSLVLKMIKQLDHIVTDDLLVRLAIRQDDSSNLRGTVLSSVHSIIHSATDAMTELTLLCTNLERVTNDMETEQEDDTHYSEQKQLIENVMMVDKTYGSVSQAITSALNDCQTLVGTLQKAVSDVQQYLSNVSVVRQGCSERESKRETEEWECNTCGILNDNNKTICEACFQRRI